MLRRRGLEAAARAIVGRKERGCGLRHPLLSIGRGRRCGCALDGVAGRGEEPGCCAPTYRRQDDICQLRDGPVRAEVEEMEICS